MSDEVKKPNRSRRVLALLVLAALLAFSPITGRVPQADALGAHDAEVLRLINNHRAGLGLRPFVEHGPLSAASKSWSATMRRNSSLPCGFQGHRHDPNLGSLVGMPPGTSYYGENIRASCGSRGLKRDQGFTYGAGCRGAIDSGSALGSFCAWINSSGHRANIESRRFTHIGLGTDETSPSGLHKVFSTNRFATAPVAAPAPPPPPPLPAAPAAPTVAPAPTSGTTTCGGYAVTVNMRTGQGRPTSGRDVILGTNGPDVIRAGGGNDIICGGGGIDRIYGGGGNDLINGEGGSDRIFGEAGADVIYGGSGSDRIWGGAAGDVLFGNGGKDLMYGGDGNDHMQGNWQSDQLRGGNGNDVLRGAGGRDRLYGEGGNDFIYGGLNTDFLDGGAGYDVGDGQQGRDNPVRVGTSGCIGLSLTKSC